MSILILHTNDFHGHLRGDILSRLQTLRPRADLYFDCGDCIKTGNLGIPVKPDDAWPALAGLNCTASVPGNRESHVLDKVFQMKLAGAEHPILCANMRDRAGHFPLPRTLEIETKGVRLGLVGVMVPMVTAKMATQAASQFLWDAPIPTASELAEELRPRCDLLIALTHIGFAQDRKLAEACDLFDLIIGGHSHTVLETPEVIGKTSILQAGSHGRFAGICEWDGRIVSYRLEKLGATA